MSALTSVLEDSQPRPDGSIEHARPGTALQPYDLHLQQQQTMRAFAQATGGEVCLNFNDLAKCFARAGSDSNAYSCWVLSAPGRPRPRLAQAEGRGGRKGAHVRARQGFYVPEPAKDDEQRRTGAIAAALASPIEFTELPMSVRWTNFHGKT